ncbi:PIN domain-containing protein [Bradyrhizobium yuanmingense]|uniref:PIN domain-containing protein n=1 Tax=Bradyrhizobium yuanmingense TaxID=108015 RepID=UPI0012E35B4A|nr:PIN domain-containing protein [Bradyrhizobium yuanmingense]
MAKQSNPDFHIVLESSVVFAGGCRNLLSHPLSAAIKALSKVRDVRVSWYLPEAVKLEREFQMTAAAEALLSDFRGLEKLLATDFKVSKDDIVRAVRDNIEKSMADHSLSVIELDTKKVDWSSVLRAAIYRHPPFQVGEKEKGFRDAVILETFCQKAETLAKDKNSRIVFLANDDLLFYAAEKRANELGENVSVVRRLTELSSSINAIPAHLSMAEISDILLKAATVFYRPNDGTTLFYNAKVADVIREKFSAQLAERPEGVGADAAIEFAGFEIGRPTFLEKNADLLEFSTVVNFNFWVGTSSPGLITASSPAAASTVFTSASPISGTTSTVGVSGINTVSSVLGSGGVSPIVGPFSTGSPILGPFLTGGTIVGPFSTGNNGGSSIISISNLSPSRGANTSQITITTGVRRTLRHDFEVRWRAKLANDAQLTEAKFRAVESLPTDP